MTETTQSKNLRNDLIRLGLLPPHKNFIVVGGDTGGTSGKGYALISIGREIYESMIEADYFGKRFETDKLVSVIFDKSTGHILDVIEKRDVSMGDDIGEISNKMLFKARKKLDEER